jgi:hypothetical protein
MLGIVSGGDILIKDNWANGRHNRAQGSSIVINASLIALGESFTIEHQNDDRDAYQGTDPDERGYIILTCSIAQWRRGYVHRSNHTRTGYGKSYHYDFRLEFSGPPGFGADFTGHYNHLRLESGVSQLVGVTANRLTIDAGAQIILDGDSALTVQGNIDLNGTAENPIIFTTLEIDSANILIAVSDENSHVNFSHVIFHGNIKVSLNSGTIDISNSNFAQDVSFEGNLQVESSVFSGEVSLTSFEILTVRHSVFTKGVTIDGNTEDGRFINNTVVGAHREGLLLNQFRSLRIVNNIIFANEWGIVNHDQESPILLYNDVFGSGQDDYIDCNAGEGSISEDPLFVNFDEGDYELV